MTFGIIDTPYSIYTSDFVHAIEAILDQKCTIIDYKEKQIPSVDVVFLYDDIHHQPWPVVEAVKMYLKGNKKLVAVGNGICTLQEWEVLPGQLDENVSQRIVSTEVEVKTVHKAHFITEGLQQEQGLLLTVGGLNRVWSLGEYYREALKNEQILFRYVSGADEITDVNNSELNITGMCNVKGNVVGILFHPERAVDDDLGNTDGKNILLAASGKL